MTFLSSKASSQVNVEGQSRLNEKMLEEPHPLMFQKLQDQVTRLPYPHFDLKPTFIPGLEEFSQTLNIRHPGSCPIQLGRLRHIEEPWPAKGRGWDSTPGGSRGPLNSWPPHRLNQQGYLSSQPRLEKRPSLSEAPTLRKQHVLTAQGRSAQKILEGKHKDSKQQGTWGGFYADIQA